MRDGESRPAASLERATRKGSAPIKVYCLPEERERIRANADAVGLSASSFLLAVGQGYAVRGVVDQAQVRELARINGDLGRLGGLLKLWLTQSAHVAVVGASTIRSVLRQVESTQEEMGRVMERIVRPGAGPSVIGTPGEEGREA